MNSHKSGYLLDWHFHPGTPAFLTLSLATHKTPGFLRIAPGSSLSAFGIHSCRVLSHLCNWWPGASSVVPHHTCKIRAPAGVALYVPAVSPVMWFWCTRVSLHAPPSPFHIPNRPQALQIKDWGLFMSGPASCLRHSRYHRFLSFQWTNRSNHLFLAASPLPTHPRFSSVFLPS